MKARWYWRCVNSGGCVMEHGCAELITVDHLKDSIRGMKQDESPEEYRRIMDEAQTIGCFYCMAETPGCGLVKIPPDMRPPDDKAVAQLTSALEGEPGAMADGFRLAGRLLDDLKQQERTKPTMQYRTNIVLGDTYVDLVSDWEGVAISVYFYLNGCARVEIAAKDENGEPKSFVFDEVQLTRCEIIANLGIGITAEYGKIVSEKPGGPRDSEPVPRG